MQHAPQVKLLVTSREPLDLQLEKNLDFLSVTARDLPVRHRSLRAVFDHSWKLLSREEQRVMCGLSV